jgi:ornithine cyclodeaminase/alanine dehydrogenase-like protein (mu-crystallin family)
MTETVQFADAQIALIREAEVREHLSLEQAIGDVRDAFSELARGRAVNCPRVRVESRQRGIAWLHTLRGGLADWNVIGGKDYTSIGLSAPPAMWATVVNVRTGLPVALVEARYLSRIRTAATTAVATDLLAPPEASCLAHFGAGTISELTVKAILKVRPLIRQVYLVRRDSSKGAPQWLPEIKDGVAVEMADAEYALSRADLATTATNSKTPVIPTDAHMPRLRHLNLIGSNHRKRREISESLARKCLPPDGYLVVDDREQAANEAGDFLSVVEARSDSPGSAGSGRVTWNQIPTIDKLFVEGSGEKEKASRVTLTAFKSVGIGLMDLALAVRVLQRMKLL